MSFYKSFHWVSMSIGLGDINLISVFIMLRFGWQNENHKSNQTMRLSKKVIWIHPNKMWFFAVSIWVGSVCDFSIGFVRFWTPQYLTTFFKFHIV